MIGDRNICYWCNSKDMVSWCNKGKNDEAVRCTACGIISMKNMPSHKELCEKYSMYESNVHKTNIEHNKKRQKMYELELKTVLPFLNPASSILDVGCANGDFLKLFKGLGHTCHGVEIGDESSSLASKMFKVYHGEFPNLQIDKKFDLIIFRGTIEHFLDPKSYLEKAISLLNDEGLIFITSTPNADSICCELYRERWNQFHPMFHLYHFSTSHFDNFFSSHSMHNVHTGFPYLETPYADLQNDISLVTKACHTLREGKTIDHDSPAFFKNMMSLIYRKKHE